jgi:membrane protein
LGIIIPVLPERGIAPDLIRGLIEQGRTLGLIGFALFLWFSTRLFGSLRAVLREIFGIPQERGILRGKLFDVQMVLVTSALFLLNLGVTIVLNLARGLGIEVLGLSGRSVGFVETGYAFVTAWFFIFVMFLLIFRYIPARRLPWRSAALAAGVTAVGWEFLKGGFSFYLTRFANFESIYGNLATVIVIVLWLYYSSIVFLFGGEVAHVYEQRHARPPAEGVGL